MGGDQGESPASVDALPIPTVSRLGWMMFMQPERFHRLAEPFRGERGDDSPRRTFLGRVTLAFLISIPALTASTAGLLALLGVKMIWVPMVACISCGGVLGAVVAGNELGVIICCLGGILPGAVLQALFEPVVGERGFVAAGAAPHLSHGAPGYVAASVIIGSVSGFAVSVARDGRHLLRGLFAGVVLSLVLGLWFVAFGEPAGMPLLFAAFVATYLRLPFWCAEAAFTWLASRATLKNPSLLPRICPLLPFRHHDVIWLPLPGLYSLLLQAAEHEPDGRLCKGVLHDAAHSPAQRRAARLALVELQARDLDKAARNRTFGRVAELDLPFFPKLDTPDFSEAGQRNSARVLRAFHSAAKDLIAGGSHQRQREAALSRAGADIESFRKRTLKDRDPDPLSRRLLSTAGLWIDVIDDERRKLGREVKQKPEVPSAFVAGAALTPDDPENRTLFKARDALIELIQHDLAPNQRGALFVFGQRRMGKTSLLNYLPILLGNGARVVPVDFQTLSLDPHRQTPHRAVLSALASTVGGALAPPDSPDAKIALDWLKRLDRTLTDRSLLVVIDEIERVEDGIRVGWCNRDFLDFLGGAGSDLRRIRFLLLCGYPLHRLGDHWVDRLVSVTSRSISYLADPDARDLMQHPIPDFPDIYPEGGVDRILAATACHPYLLQKVGDELCRLLNAAHRQKATDADLEKALDAVVNGADLFDELWRQRNDEERASLKRMAGASAPIEPDPAARDLVRQGFAVKDEGGKVAIAVPLFREWIVEHKGT
jgi:uncharacterized protein